MSYFMNTVEEDRCVFISYEGEMTALQLSATRYEAEGVLHQRHWNRLVVDVTQWQSVLTTSELFDFARGLSSRISRATRVALIVRPEQERHAALIQKIARKGRVFLTYFMDPEKAMGWMKQAEPRRQSFQGGIMRLTHLR